MSERPFCPECDSGKIAKKTNKPCGKEESYEWRCRLCQTNFSDPNYRETKIPPEHHGRSGLSKALVDMDPDEL